METTNIPWPVIAQKLAALGKKPAWLAIQLRTGTNTITNWKKRGGAPLSRAREIAEALQCTTDDLLISQPEPDHISAPADTPVTGQDTDLTKRLLPSDKGNVVTWERPEDLEPDEDRVWIDRYDYRFSAGEGLIQWEVRQKKALPFDRGFFRALGSNPKDCKLLVVRGDSMEPFLFNRDMFMVDTAKTRIHDGGIYAVYFEDEALVKQIFKKPGGALTLHSYNTTKFPDREISAGELEYVKVVGELIYRSGSGPAGGN